MISSPHTGAVDARKHVTQMDGVDSYEFLWVFPSFNNQTPSWTIRRCPNLGTTIHPGRDTGGLLGRALLVTFFHETCLSLVELCSLAHTVVCTPLRGPWLSSDGLYPCLYLHNLEHCQRHNAADESFATGLHRGAWRRLQVQQINVGGREPTAGRESVALLTRHPG